MNPRVTEMAGSTIRALHARKKKTSIDLGLGEPSLGPTMKYFEAASRFVAENGCRYTPNAGEPALREAIAAHYRYPMLDKAENVCTTAGGSQEGVYLAIKTLLNPAKDSLLVVEPAFPVYVKCGMLEGIEVDRVEMVGADDFAFDAERILGAITPRTRMIVICSPCNPTARTIDRATVEAIVRGLERRGGDPIYVLHDEIYRELSYTSDAGHFADIYPHTISINSLSKSNALTGMRIGWVIAPARETVEIIKAHGWITSTANTFAQRIALEIFAAPDGLREHAQWYGAQRQGVIEALDRSGMRYLPIDGTFYATVELGEGVDSLAAAHRLIDEHDVVAIPGRIFAASLESWLRLSWVAPLDQFEEGARRIARAYAGVSA